MPRAERGLDTVPQALARRGIKCEVVPVYRTVPDEAGRKAYREALALGADVVVFASPSAARAGSSDLKLSGAAAVAIGPTTAAALRALKIDPVVAKDPSPEALAKAAVLAARSLP
jgi:uroporphyrinogen-III synthase